MLVEKMIVGSGSRMLKGFFGGWNKWNKVPLATCNYCTARSAVAVGTMGKAVSPKPGAADVYFEFNQRLREKPEWKEEIIRTMLIYPEFLNLEEEESLMKELEPYLSRLHYETSHWDDAIHHYRETERSRWNKKNEEIINRVRSLAFPPNVSPLKLVHVLDLAKNGVIKPHVDSVRFCGTTIAGISLLSSSIMRLRLEEDKEVYCDVLLPRLSLYVMKDYARFKYTHEIMSETESCFKGELVPRDRRISIICRNEPVGGDAPVNDIFQEIRPL
jgi:alkylated DNA repair protein alkB family protein 7